MNILNKHHSMNMMEIPPEEVLHALKQNDMATNQWAIDLLPLTSANVNAKEVMRKSYKYILKHHSRCPTSFLTLSIQGAMLRECQKKVLSDRDRYKYVFNYAELRANLVKEEKWERTLRKFCSSIRDKEIQTELLDMSINLLNSYLIQNAEKGANLMRGLLKAPDIYLPKDTIDFFKDKTLALRVIMKNFLKYLTNQNAPMEMIVEFCQNLPVDSKMIEAVLALKNLPTFIIQKVVTFIRKEPVYSLAVIAIMKNWKVIVQNEYLTFRKILQYVTTSKIFHLEKNRTIVNFFNQIITYDDNGSDDLIKTLFDMLCEHCPIDIFRSLHIVVVNKPIIEDKAIELMTNDSTIEYLNDWCFEYSCLLNIVSGENKAKLIDYLTNQLDDEILNGHGVTSDGRIQIMHSMPISSRSNLSFTGDLGDIPVGKYIQNTTVFKGWRVMAILLSLLPIKEENIKYLKYTCSIHGRALTPTYISILAKHSCDVVIDFVTFLSKGNTEFQSVLINLVFGLFEERVHFTLFFDFMQQMSSMALDEKTPSVLRCMIIRRFSNFKQFLTNSLQEKTYKEFWEEISIFQCNEAELDAIKSATMAKKVEIRAVLSDFAIPNSLSALNSGKHFGSCCGNCFGSIGNSSGRGANMLDNSQFIPTIKSNFHGHCRIIRPHNVAAINPLLKRVSGGSLHMGKLKSIF